MSTTQKLDAQFFDKGGATINAMHSDFDPDTSTRTTRATTVQNAINYSKGLTDPRPVYVPEPLFNYDASAVTFDNSVRMIREGGNPGVYDVKAYGAAADWDGISGTDDSAAFDSAADAARTTADIISSLEEDVNLPEFHVPNGTYLLTSSIHFGDAGSGRVAYITSAGARIVGQTSGQPVFDFSGSNAGSGGGQGRVIDGPLTVVGSSTDTPNIGALLAREQGGDSNGHNYWKRFDVVGQFSLCSVYNYASEEFHVLFSRFHNSAGRAAYIGTESNADGVTSPHITLASGAHSNLGHRFGPGCDLRYRRSNNAPADATVLEFGSCSSVEVQASTLDDTSDTAPYIRLVQETSSLQSVSLTGLMFHTVDTQPAVEVDGEVLTLVYEGNRWPDPSTSTEITGISGSVLKRARVMGLTGGFDFSAANCEVLNNSVIRASWVKVSKMVEGDISFRTISTTSLPSDMAGTIRSMDLGAIYPVGDVSTISDGDASPAVFGRRVLKSNNSAATTVTTFDGGHEGQEIVFIFGDGNTTIQDQSNGSGDLVLSGGVDFAGSGGDIITFIHEGGFWREVSRTT